ncbi:MAG: hypothetical protein FWH27_11130 [Planctomycetaceae bacterium]|nr:hypothetical protein [Planctomycetaceae bacterium]
MSNTVLPHFFDKIVSNQCLKYSLVFAIISCFLAAGCKSSDKSKSFFPFYGDGTAANSPANEFPPGQPPIDPAPQVIVQNGPGPATPSSPGLSAQALPASTSSTSNAYAPPELVPAATSSPYARNDTTPVYDPPPGTNTNSGGTAGTIPNTYSSSSSSNSTTRGGTPSSGYSYDGTSANGTSTTGDTSSYSNGGYSNGTSYGTASPTGSTSKSTNGTNYGGSSYGGTGYDSGNGNSGYGGSSTTGGEYSHGPSSGYNNTSLTPPATPLNDGDYLAANGAMMRVIHGKVYDLVQYTERNPPVLPDFMDMDHVSSQPATVSQTATTIQPTNDYRTAVQMTQDFGRQVPVPTYENLLSQQESGPQVSSQGIVTVTVPAQTTIIPENAAVATVASLEYSEYSEIGSLTAPSSAGGNGSAAIDGEMQRSIWSIMAGQNNDFLLYDIKSQSGAQKNDLPAYFPLSNPLAGYVGQAYGNAIPGSSNSHTFPGQSPAGYIIHETPPSLFRCPPRMVYPGY